MGQQIAAAESDAALAASTLKRYEMLKAQKSVSPQEFDEVETRVKSGIGPPCNDALAGRRSESRRIRSAHDAGHTLAFMRHLTEL